MSKGVQITLNLSRDASRATETPICCRVWARWKHCVVWAASDSCHDRQDILLETRRRCCKDGRMKHVSSERERFIWLGRARVLPIKMADVNIHRNTWQKVCFGILQLYYSEMHWWFSGNKQHKHNKLSAGAWLWMNEWVIFFVLLFLHACIITDHFTIMHQRELVCFITWEYI